jgi:hypothetical protein
LSGAASRIDWKLVEEIAVEDMECVKVFLVDETRRDD